MQAGCSNMPTVFIFSDTQIVLPSCLEDINSVLNSGSVPNLYEPEDIEEILTAVRPIAKRSGANIGQGREQLLAFYVDLVRANLHVVLAFSPVGNLFRDNCRRFPSLVNCCTIDWYDQWFEDALRSVAKRFIATSKLSQEGATGGSGEIPPDLAPSVCEVAVSMHKSVKEATLRFFHSEGRRNYTTPTSYLELIQTFIEFLEQRQKEEKARVLRYKSGAAKTFGYGVVSWRFASETEGYAANACRSSERYRRSSGEA